MAGAMQEALMVDGWTHATRTMDTGAHCTCGGGVSLLTHAAAHTCVGEVRACVRACVCMCKTSLKLYICARR